MNYEEALKQYLQATNSHDFSNVRKVLHKDAIYWFSDKTCTTMSEIQNYFETAWDIIKEEIYTAKDVRWIATDQNTATCIYIHTIIKDITMESLCLETEGQQISL